MFRWCFCVVTLCCLISLLCTGCGGSNAQFPTTKVQGNVSCKGTVLETGTVTFFPVSGGKHAVGMISKGGAFTLSTFESGDGAIIGKHKVIINVSYETPDGKSVPDSVPRVPKKYTNRDTTPLEVDVVEDGNPISLKLD